MRSLPPSLAGPERCLGWLSRMSGPDRWRRSSGSRRLRATPSRRTRDRRRRRAKPAVDGCANSNSCRRARDRGKRGTEWTAAERDGGEKGDKMGLGFGVGGLRGAGGGAGG